MNVIYLIIYFRDTDESINNHGVCVQHVILVKLLFKFTSKLNLTFVGLNYLQSRIN